MPHARYVFITQSLASMPCGVPVSRGPIESKSVCERSHVCELSMPSAHMRASTGSVEAGLRAMRRVRRGRRQAQRAQRRRSCATPDGEQSRTRHRRILRTKGEARAEASPSTPAIRRYGTVQTDVEDERRVGRNRRLRRRRRAVPERGRNDDHPLAADAHAHACRPARPRTTWPEILTCDARAADPRSMPFLRKPCT